MPRKSVSPQHSWVGASTSRLDERSASVAVRNGWVKIDVDTVLNVLEVYCFQCRRTYDDVSGEPCAAAGGVGHLIGGPVRTRKRRSHEDGDCDGGECCQLSAGQAAALREAASQKTAAARGQRRYAV